MATLVEAPRAAHNTTIIRRRAVVPVVPVIPRSLQTKRKTQTVLKPLTIHDSSKDHASSIKQLIEHEVGQSPGLECSAPGASVDGHHELRKDYDASGTVDSVENGVLNPLKIATDYQNHPVGHDVNCRPPLEHAPYAMPAPFHPAHHFPIHPSMVSPTFPLGPSGIAQITPPQSHESSANIVFGGFPGSAGPSPVLPHSPLTTTFLPRFFPNWAPAQPPQHFPDPHFQHVHGPHPRWHGPFTNYTHPQPNMYHPPTQSHAIPVDYHHRMPSFFPPENHFPYTPPPGTPFVNSFHHGPRSNGASFSTSSNDSRRNSRSVEMNALHPAHHPISASYNGMVPAPELNASQPRMIATDEGVSHSYPGGDAQLRVGSAAQENGQVNTQELGNVSDYLLTQFNHKALADCSLHLSHSHNAFKPMNFYLHRLLIVRSPLLASLMYFAGTDTNGHKRMRLELSGNLVRPDAFEMALLNVYGTPLLDYDSLIARNVVLGGTSATPLNRPGSVNTMAENLEFAIGYAAAGHILQLPDVKRRGDELASKLISWETLETGIAFALDGGRDIEKPTVSHTASSHSSSHAPSRQGSTISAASQNSDKENSGIRIPYEPHSRDDPNHLRKTNQNLTDGLLRDISRYIGTNFPSDFQLQTLTPSLPTIDRLPTTAESRPFSHPGLRAITFGDHPSEEAGTPNPQSTILSRIVLSVPFPVLVLIFEHLTPSDQARHAPSIVEERERRRDRALRSKSVPWASRLVGGARWSEVGWEESVGAVPTEASRNVRLARRWTGLRRPTRTRARRV